MKWDYKIIGSIRNGLNFVYFHGNHEKMLPHCKYTKAMEYIKKGACDPVIYTKFAKKYNTHYVWKYFANLQLVSKLLSTWPSVSMTVDQGSKWTSAGLAENCGRDSDSVCNRGMGVPRARSR